MHIAVLTSSRADFGIYLPLLKKLSSDDYFKLDIIAFGTHLEKKFGYTIDEILDSGFEVKYQIKTAPKGDTPENIAYSIGETIKKFSEFWSDKFFDLIFALGDRYEMFAAVSAASPFSLRIAHIHAGETTLGAIDNSYRHCISLMSEYLFTTTAEYKKRAIEITNRTNKVFNAGALSLDNLVNLKFLTKDEFRDKYKIDLKKSSILCTFHPETISYEKNKTYILELIEALKVLNEKYQIIITMPNADTMGLMIRDELIDFARDRKKVFLVESMGMKDYLSCMKYCSFMLGNTSSAFVEASFFPKPVINLGERQSGRIQTPNIKTVKIEKNDIITAVKKIENKEKLNKTDIYGNGHAAEAIINILKKL